MSDVQTPIWKTEFEKRIKAFSTAIRLEESKVKDILADLGADGESESSLTLLDSDEFLPFGDLRASFVEGGHTKIGILRLAMPHLRAKTNVDQPIATTGNGDSTANALRDLIASNRPKSDWTDQELLESYDETTIDVAEILGKRSRGRPCIVFKKDGSVDIEVSLKLLKIAKRQPTAESHRLDNGKHVTVYRPGIFLDKPLDESPFYPGVALVDGYCAKSSTQWNGVSHKNRVLIRLHVTQIETTQLSKREMAQLCKSAHVTNNAIPNLFDELGEAAALYEKLEDQDKLPKLKVFSNAVKDHYTGKMDTAF